MTTRLAADARKAEADAIGNLLDSGYIRIYSGTQPADPDSAPTGTLLAELTFNAAAFPAATDDGSQATITAAAITADSSADADGTAGYFRVFKSDGTTYMFDGSVTGIGGGGEMELNNTSIVLGGTVSCSSFLYRRPTA